jgi:hypothetical protein
MRYPARRWQRVLATAVGALIALVVLGFGTPAAAGVSVDPPELTQGAAVRLNFRITNESPSATITRVEVRFPGDAPIAEIYPFSAEDWAPQITMRQLDQPIPNGMHGMDPLTEVVSTITYFAMPEKGLAPGGSTDLALTAGPLPSTAHLVIGVVTTLSDGTEVRYTALPGAVPAAGERPAVVLTLKPAPPGAGGAGQGQHGGGQDQHAAQSGAQSGDAPAGGFGSGRSLLWGALAALLAVGAVYGVAHLRERRERAAGIAATIDADDAEDADKEIESDSEGAVKIAGANVQETAASR